LAGLNSLNIGSSPAAAKLTGLEAIGDSPLGVETMDPNETLKQLLATARYAVEQDDQPLAADLADLVLALDGWLSKGGFLPVEWNKNFPYETQLRDCLRDFAFMVEQELQHNGRKPHVPMRDCMGQWLSVCRDARKLLEVRS
jgi:hypothetical protein